jgi:adenylate cyclase
MVAGALMLGVVVSRVSLALASVIAVGFALAFAVSAHVALARFGVWQASAIPMAAIVVTFIGLSLYRYGLLDKERRHIRRLFQRYLSPAMVDRVVASDQLPELGGELRELTILFCDLRGFTALSERLEAAALTRVVNGFLQAATDAILAHGGTVDKYVGDAVMAFWNAPLEQPEHATLACRAALEIRRRIEALNRAPEHRNLPRLEAGIGINTGRCTVGNFGSTHRFDYSAIGDAVNIAARLESETREHDMAILLGPETAAKVTGLATVSIGTLKLRGRAEPLAIYALVAAA